MIAIKAGDKRDYLAHKLENIVLKQDTVMNYTVKIYYNHDDCETAGGIWKYFPLIWAI